MTDDRVEAGETVDAVPAVDVEAVARERDEYLDALQRLKAEFDNYRKRVARDQESLVARASERLVKQLLPMLDDLERAVEAAVEHGELKLEDGVRLVHRALANMLSREGLVEVETEGA
ncbi:MAG: nucleotide exchange factor GrpE, partial [Gaiellaceae bacterium]